jgi:hypothetical protein
VPGQPNHVQPPRMVRNERLVLPFAHWNADAAPAHSYVNIPSISVYINR